MGEATSVQLSEKLENLYEGITQLTVLEAADLVGGRLTAQYVRDEDVVGYLPYLAAVGPERTDERPEPLGDVSHAATAHSAS